MALEKTNDCYFVGELVEVKRVTPLTYTRNNAPVEAISASIVIKCILGEDEQENVFSLEAFVNKLTKSGSINKNYEEIKNIESLLGKKVVIPHAQIAGNRFWSPRTNQLVSASRLSFTFIREASKSEIAGGDKATFAFGGFIARELTEKTDADGNVLYYQLTMGQANWNENNLCLVDFAVSKDNLKAVQVMQKYYETGKTTTIRGVCQNIVTLQKEETESMFGDPIVKVYTKNDKKYLITSGDNLINGEGEYTVDAIKALNEAYVAEGEKIKRDAMNSETNEPAKSTESVKATAPKKTALSGLFD